MTSAIHKPPTDENWQLEGIAGILLPIGSIAHICMAAARAFSCCSEPSEPRSLAERKTDGWQHLQFALILLIPIGGYLFLHYYYNARCWSSFADKLTASAAPYSEKIAAYEETIRHLEVRQEENAEAIADCNRNIDAIWTAALAEEHLTIDEIKTRYDGALRFCRRQSNHTKENDLCVEFAKKLLANGRPRKVIRLLDHAETMRHDDPNRWHRPIFLRLLAIAYTKVQNNRRENLDRAHSALNRAINSNAQTTLEKAESLLLRAEVLLEKFSIETFTATDPILKDLQDALALYQIVPTSPEVSSRLATYTFSIAVLETARRDLSVTECEQLAEQLPQAVAALSEEERQEKWLVISQSYMRLGKRHLTHSGTASLGKDQADALRQKGYSLCTAAIDACPEDEQYQKGCYIQELANHLAALPNSSIPSSGTEAVKSAALLYEEAAQYYVLAERSGAAVICFVSAGKEYARQGSHSEAARCYQLAADSAESDRSALIDLINRLKCASEQYEAAENFAGRDTCDRKLVAVYQKHFGSVTTACCLEVLGVQFFRDCLRSCERLQEPEEVIIKWKLRLANACEDLGLRGSFPTTARISLSEVSALYEEALTLRKELGLLETTEALFATLRLAYCQEELAERAWSSVDFPKAIDLWTKAIASYTSLINFQERFKTLFFTEPPADKEPGIPVRLACCQCNLGRLLLNQGNAKAAEELCRSAISYYMTVEQPSSSMQKQLRKAQEVLGRSLLTQGLWEEGFQQMQAAIIAYQTEKDFESAERCVTIIFDAFRTTAENDEEQMAIWQERASFLLESVAENCDLSFNKKGALFSMAAELREKSGHHVQAAADYINAARFITLPDHPQAVATLYEKAIQQFELVYADLEGELINLNSDEVSTLFDLYIECLVKYSQEHQKIADYDQAISNLEKALGFVIDPPEKPPLRERAVDQRTSVKLDILYALATSYEAKEDWSNAAMWFERAAELYETQEGEAERAGRCFSNASIHYARAGDDANMVKNHRLAVRLLGLAEKHDLIIEYSVNLSDLVSSRDAQRAAQFLQAAATAAKISGQPDQAAVHLANAGKLYGRSDRFYKEAAECFIQAAKLHALIIARDSQFLNERLLAGECYLQAAECYTTLKEHDNALTYLHKAKEFFQTATQIEIQSALQIEIRRYYENGSIGLTKCLAALGTHSLNRGQELEAARYFDEAGDVANIQEARSYQLQASLLYEKVHAYQEALGCLSSLISYYPPNDYCLEAANLHKRIGNCHVGNGNLSKAAYSFRNAAALYANPSKVAECLERAGDLFIQLKNHNSVAENTFSNATEYFNACKDYPSVIRCAQKAIDLSTSPAYKTSHILLMVKAHIAMGDYRTAGGLCNNALQETTMSVTERAPFQELAADCYTSLGDAEKAAELFFAAGQSLAAQPEAARKPAEETARLYRRSALSYRAAAGVANENGRHAIAESLEVKAKELFTLAGETYLSVAKLRSPSALNYANAGECFHEAGDLDAANSNFVAAADLYRSKGNQYLQNKNSFESAENFLSASECYQKAGQQEKARKGLQLARLYFLNEIAKETAKNAPLTDNIALRIAALCYENAAYCSEKLNELDRAAEENKKAALFYASAGMHAKSAELLQRTVR